jgi:ABC-type ATPase involved in cell division
VGFALEVIGAPRSSIPGRVARVLTRVGLASKGNALPRELSGGEQQRVAIARALVNDPFLLVADEPTGNLDERATRGIFQLLREIHMAGTAVVMATHDLDTLFAICDRVAVLVDKKIRVGTLAEHLQDPHPWIRAYFHGPRGRAAHNGHDSAIDVGSETLAGLA